jgi:hypothetical protein
MERFRKNMKKRKKTIFTLILSICIFWLSSCKTNDLPTISLENDLQKKIIEDCKQNTTQSPNNSIKNCQVKLNDLFEFSWDIMYVFDAAVDDNVISEQIGKKFLSTSSYYSKKWFFLKDGKIVNFNEKVIKEIDKPIENGDVDFEIRDSQHKFAAFKNNSAFDVDELNVGNGRYYYLKCVTCN